MTKQNVLFATDKCETVQHQTVADRNDSLSCPQLTDTLTMGTWKKSNTSKWKGDTSSRSEDRHSNQCVCVFVSNQWKTTKWERVNRVNWHTNERETFSGLSWDRDRYTKGKCNQVCLQTLPSGYNNKWAPIGLSYYYSTRKNVIANQ